MTTSSITPADLGIPAKFHSWRPGQWAAIESGASSDKTFVTHAAPTGCHHPEQLIMLHDGTTRMAHQITKGDLLMGPDSQPRQVVNLHTGEDRMHLVTPVKGDPFVVNQGHILSLVRTETGEVVNITVDDYYKTTKWFKHLHKLYRVGVEHQSYAGLPLDPYFMGVILGDGGFTTSVSIHKPDPEMRQLANEQAAKFGLHVRVANDGDSFYLVGNRGDGENPITKILRSLNLWGCKSGDKFVPQQYLYSDRETRLQVLAGLLDTDGSLSSNTYDFISKSFALATAVVQLSRGLGLSAYMKPCTKSCQNGFTGNYWRVCISGHTSMVPCRIPRKKATTRSQIKDVLRTGFSVEPLGVDEYFGFEVTGDNLYLMDDFTVTHNSGKSLIAVAHAILTGGRSVYLTSTKGLQDQCSTDFSPCGMIDMRGRQNYRCHRGQSCADGRIMGCKGDEDGFCEYSDARTEFLKSKLTITNYSCYLSNVIHGEGMGDIDLLILDEAHEAIEELASALEIRLNHASNASLYSSLGIPPPYQSPLPKWKYWASQSIPKIRAQVQTFKSEGGGDLKLLRALDALLKNVTRLAAIEDTWIVDESSKPAEVLFSPVWPTDYAQKILFRGIKHILLVSATIVPKTLELLGVPDDDSLYVSHTNVFPASRCPVYLYGATRIDHRSTNSDYQQLIGRMDTIISRRLDRKGIIHPTSYDRQQMIAANSRYADIMLLPKGQGLTNMLKTFRESDPPSILNSPAVTTGYDFPGNQCEYQFLVKVPFIDTRSPIMQARAKADPEYASYLTAQTLVQTCGRAMRGIEDQCESFLMDQHANWFFKGKTTDWKGKTTGGYRHLFPEWFLRQLVYPKGPPAPPPKLAI